MNIKQDYLRHYSRTIFIDYFLKNTTIFIRHLWIFNPRHYNLSGQYYTWAYSRNRIEQLAIALEIPPEVSSAIAIGYYHPFELTLNY
ncbi:MAG: hypothetical protein AAGA18_13550 [Verrucomicrobiota bacterium]